ncbi:MAG: biopolymer transporter Tol [Ignavibacteriae bacterium]|jgi:Tol biopolymer transport system component|nr:biopolymer transporter Tol [Ignavibacteriota bacterium]NOG97000.1 biopolymer transporter Tol [Ignavibacteriota bacterium]
MIKKTNKYLLTAILFLLAAELFAQFGRNRVQYKEYDWYYIQTKHFDIYFSPEGETAAEFTAHAAEEALEQFQTDFNYKINNRIALIVYNSHNDFQETNTTDSYLSQGIGGFTEPFKNRVVFPFEGGFQKFRHVIRHELVHAVMRDMLYGGTVQNIISKGITLQLPLWFHEGMAEFLSSGWETNSDMFIRDAIINEYLPDINRLGGYFAYRGGQSLFYYIAETYGREKVGELLNKIKGLGNVQAGIKSSIGLSIEELNDRWKKELKREYWPGIAERQDPEEFAKRLTDNKKVGGFYNTSPAISPQGDKVVFISDRDIYMDVYVMNTFDGEVIKKVIASGKTNDFEELNVLFPSLTWAPDNKRIALSRKSSGYDRIFIADVEDGDGVDLPFKLDGIESVSWSPDGTKLALNGSNTKQSDIYVYNFETEELTNITNDIFSDYQPVWGSDSKTIFFSSDRGEFTNPQELSENFFIFNHDYEHNDLYSVNIESEEIIRLTDWELSDESSPVISPDMSEILFISDKNGIDNIYKKKINFSDDDPYTTVLETPAIPITNSLNGINGLSLSKDGKKLVFSSLYNAGYNIYLLNNPFEIELDDPNIKPTNFMARLIKSSNESTDVVIKDDNNVLSNSIYGDILPVTEVVSPENIAMNEIDTDDVESVENNKAVEDSAGKSSSKTPTIVTGQIIMDDEVERDTNKTDYSNYVFGSEIKQNDSTRAQEREELFTETLDSDGNYLVNKYKISFSPDLIYANAGYSTFYGLLGTTVLSFSDVLGNHRLVGVTSLQIDLKNSDYGLAYYYLPKKIDYGIEAFHTARFLFVNRGGFSSELYRYRNFGGVLSARLPISSFYRVDASVSYLNVSSENLDNPAVPTEKVSYVIPSINFVHDNTLFGYTSPIEGVRYRFGLFGNPGIGDTKRSFYSVTWDYRRYMRFWFDNSFVFRFSGGYSGGANAQRFFLGGTEGWINRTFATGDIPIDGASDFAFLSPALPLRGYNYAEKLGTKYALMNLELRIPIIRYLVTGGLPLFFQNVLGVAFVDVGSAWDKTEKLQLIGKNENGKTVTNDMLLGLGYGFRVYFIFLWKFDMAYSYDLDKFSKPKFYLSIGLDF